MYLINGKCFASVDLLDASSAAKFWLSTHSQILPGHVLHPEESMLSLTDFQATFVDIYTGASFSRTVLIPQASADQCLFPGDFAHFGSVELDDVYSLFLGFLGLVVVVIAGQMLQRVFFR